MRLVSSHSFYSCAAHDELLAAWNVVKNEDGPLDLDLSSVSFFDPYGIVALVVFLQSLPDYALPVSLKMNEFPLAKGQKPSERGAVAYLTEMGFWEEVGGRLATHHTLLPVRPQFSEDKNVLIDVTVMHTRDAISVMLRKSGELLQSLGFSPVAKMHVLQVLSEVSGNVLDHAQSDIGGVVTSQTYRSRRSSIRYLVMSIGDAGVGVRNSLSHNQKLASRLDSDATALGVAVGMGNSRFGNGGRGGGLPSVLDIAKKYGGSVAMRSGRGALAYRGEDDQKRVFDAPPQLGTQVRIMLPENRLREK
ncbi:hypothetical protein IAD21_03431 [Abditibacteriota bacterium]|nr:hypothetical protein IAD21_03431 [Abditibacteriota bacterium]